MAVIGWKERAYSLGVRGKIGKPDTVGDFWLGYSDLGYQNKFSGIYQSRPRKTGRIHVKMKYCIPPQPRTTKQQGGRIKFALAVDSWNNLPFENQVVWNKKRYPYHMSGYNRFISNYLKITDIELFSYAGIYVLGKSELGNG
jgi:hypothetical protein